MPHLSIKAKLTIWYLLFLFVVLLFFSGISYLIVTQNISNAVNDSASVSLLEVGRSSQTAAGQASALSSSGYRPLVFYTLSDEQVKRIQTAPTAPISALTADGNVTIDQKNFITSQTEGAQRAWLYYRPSPVNSGSYEVIAVTRSKSAAVSIAGQFQRILLIALPLTILLAGVLGYVLVRVTLRPVTEISRAAREIQKNNLQRRIEVKTNDELGRLSATLNQAFDSVQSSFERERRFTSDASHELRTPLAIAQGEATLALTQERTNDEYRRALESISQEVSRTVSIVTKLLALARADNGVAVANLTDISLNGLLLDIGADIQLLCEQKGLSFKSSLAGDVLVRGEAGKLRELFLNLLDNAIKYTPSGGQVTLSLARSDGTVQIKVEDTGLGISEEHLPHIFERFYRVRKTHECGVDGSGLGLAICQQIAEAHKGKIEVESRLGTGSVFTVRLPQREILSGRGRLRTD